MKNKKKAELLAKHIRQKKEWNNNKDFVDNKKIFELEYQLAMQLHEARKSAGITQKEIAARLNTRQSAISRIEKGRNITFETLAKYAAVCGKKVKLELCDSV